MSFVVSVSRLLHVSCRDSVFGLLHIIDVMLQT